MNTHISKQPTLFSDHDIFVEYIPIKKDLQPASNISNIFEDCHNYIYANEGMLKEKIFHEMVKILLIKLHDEYHNDELKFRITLQEYQNIVDCKQSSFIDRFQNMLECVKKKYSKFFTEEEKIYLKPLTLGYIVARLQNISLLNTPSDIKGEAFQKFVHKNQRGDRGEFFTPYPIVKMAVEMLCPTPNEKVLDSACGSGGFLIQTIAYITKNYPNIDHTHYIRKNIKGMEFNADVGLSALMRMVFEGGIGEEIVCTNSLENHHNLHNYFDVILTNPPFGNKGKIEDVKILELYELAHQWKKNSGLWKPTLSILKKQAPDILFIEQNLRFLRPGGRMAIVLPDGILQNPSNSYVREWVLSQAKILAVISIPQEAFVPYGTGIKTSLVILQKYPSIQKDTFMAKLKNIGYNAKGNPIYKHDHLGNLRYSGTDKCIEDDTPELVRAYNQFQNNQPWNANDSVFTVSPDLLKKRWDVESHQPTDVILLANIERNHHKKLCELADIIASANELKDSEEQDVRYIAISDIDYRTMQIVHQQILKKYELPSRATYSIRTGDILTAIAGASTGTEKQASAIVTEKEDGAICSNGFAVLRNIREVEPLFLLAYMRSNLYFRQVKRKMTGHAIPNITIRDLSEIIVYIPSLEKQRQIANNLQTILDFNKKIDTALKKLEKDVNLLIPTM